MRSRASRFRWPIALLVVLLAQAGSARADIVFSNFGSNDSYDPFHGATVGYLTDFNLLRHVAVLFRVGKQAVTLDRIDVAMGSAVGPNVVDLEILPNVNGVPGPDNQALESFHLMNTLPPLGSDGPPLMIPSVLHPHLDANTGYWLAAIAARPTQDGWNYNILGDLDTFALRDNNGSWMALTGLDRPAFRILATPVAEPATVGLLGLGILGLVGYWRSRAKGLY